MYTVSNSIEVVMYKGNDSIKVVKYTASESMVFPWIHVAIILSFNEYR